MNEFSLKTTQVAMALLLDLIYTSQITTKPIVNADGKDSTKQSECMMLDANVVANEGLGSFISSCNT